MLVIYHSDTVHIYWWTLENEMLFWMIWMVWMVWVFVACIDWLIIYSIYSCWSCCIGSCWMFLWLLEKGWWHICVLLSFFFLNAFSSNAAYANVCNTQYFSLISLVHFNSIKISSIMMSQSAPTMVVPMVGLVSMDFELLHKSWQRAKRLAIVLLMGLLLIIFIIVSCVCCCTHWSNDSMWQYEAINMSCIMSCVLYFFVFLTLL